ncbi:hypothetical protein JOD52_001173 [Brachybacterium muris]|uniref:hypothetical protein n=1 Tax=Brachybacterium muris TaxID=219301 RepID=UPI001957496E|nr:hypothetical protein [Brachybacterium muris]MBM7500333.1 hypothetical protein [Brachybacterium muris]MCT1430172.1 hypothetical protein [Brachybacterium muris]
MTASIELETHSWSNADDLGYLGQQAVAEAAQTTDYRIVGGHMVRLLLLAHPAELAVQRTTVDADAAVSDVEVVGPIVDRLKDQDFVQERGNVYTKAVDEERQVEINLLLPRTGSTTGIKPQMVDGVGQVDTLPELAFVLLQPAIHVAVTAHLTTGETLAYRVPIPGLEGAFILKAHAWAARGLQHDRDLADLHTLLEIREAHPDLPWRLGETHLRGVRLDTARAVSQLPRRLQQRTSLMPVPKHLDRSRMAALLVKHVATP